METCNIIATGYSLNNIDTSKIEGYRIGVNHVFKHIEVDELVWWDNEIEKMDFLDFKGNINTLTIRKRTGNNIVKWTNRGTKKLNRNLNHVANFNSSVCMAINIAINKGFTKIYLFGVDSCLTDGYLHFYDKEPQKKGCGLQDWEGKIFPLFERFYARIQASLVDEKIYAVDSATKSFINMTYNEYLELF